MKKLIIVLLALSVFGVMAFAQDAPALVLSGSLYTGFEVDGAGSALTTRIYDTGGNGLPSDWWLAAALSGTAAGLKFEIVSKDAATVITDATYGWWKPIDMLSLKAGVGYGAAYTTPIEGWGKGGTGFQALLSVAGATVGVDYKFALAAANFDATNLILAASYAITDIATLGGGYDLSGGGYAWVGVSVKAVKDLKANIDFNYTVTGSAYAVEGDFSYAVMGITPGLWVTYTSVTTNAWAAKLYASYAMDTLTPGAYFRYNADGSFSGGANLAIAVEKQTINVYADVKGATITWDFGVNYKMAF